MALSVLAHSLLATTPLRKGRYLCQVFLGMCHQYSQALEQVDQSTKLQDSALNKDSRDLLPWAKFC